MRYETTKIIVEGQLSGPALLHEYILDTISAAPDRLRPAVIVCVGSAFSERSDREGEPVVMRFLSMGCSAFLLDYSVAPDRFPTALKELACSVAFVREHSSEWHIDPEKILVCGFSAGGHVCCSLGCWWNDEKFCSLTGLEPDMIKPDGMILCYPVITGGKFAHERSMQNLLGDDIDKYTEIVSLERHISKDTPRAFIWHTYTDGSVPVENSLMLADALRKAGVNFELHIFPEGEHGSSLANEETSGSRTELVIPAVQKWIDLVSAWIKDL